MKDGNICLIKDGELRYFMVEMPVTNDLCMPDIEMANDFMEIRGAFKKFVEGKNLYFSPFPETNLDMMIFKQKYPNFDIEKACLMDMITHEHTECMRQSCENGRLKISGYYIEIHGTPKEMVYLRKKDKELKLGLSDNNQNGKLYKSMFIGNSESMKLVIEIARKRKYLIDIPENVIRILEDYERVTGQYSNFRFMDISRTKAEIRITVGEKDKCGHYKSSDVFLNLLSEWHEEILYILKDLNRQNRDFIRNIEGLEYRVKGDRQDFENPVKIELSYTTAGITTTKTLKLRLLDKYTIDKFIDRGQTRLFKRKLLA